MSDTAKQTPPETKAVDLDALRRELERAAQAHPELRRDAGRTIAAIDRRQGRRR